MSGLDERFRQNIQYCADQVRRFQEDKFLAAQFASEEDRACLMAVYAFGLEITRIPEIVSEAPLGAIRQQWWRDALAEIYQAAPVRAHPVVEALAVLLRADPDQHLRAGFDAVIDGTGFYLEGEGFRDPDHLWQVVCESHGRLAALAAQMLDAKKIPPAEAPFLIDQETLYVLSACASDVLVSHGTSAEAGVMPLSARFAEIMKKNRTKNLSFLADRLEEPQRQKKISAAQTPLLAHCTLSKAYLKRARKGCVEEKKSPQTIPPPIGGLEKRLRLFLTALTGRI